MPRNPTRTAGRHSAPAASRTAKRAGHGRRATLPAPALTSLPAARALQRKRPPLALISVAAFGLVAGFLITPAANANELSSPFVAAFQPGSSQTVVVAEDAGLLTIQRDGYSVTSKPVVPAYVQGSSTNADWAALVLTDGGWPTSPTNVTALLQWMDSENAPQSWWNRNNPLNNGYGSGGGAGFGSYPDLRTAAQYAADLLHANPVYSDIIAALAASAPVETTVAAIQASPWASSHYGYGSLWHAVDVPIVAADPEDW